MSSMRSLAFATAMVWLAVATGGAQGSRTYELPLAPGTAGLKK